MNVEYDPEEVVDQIAEAIAKVEGERTVTMCEVPVTIASTGRPVVLHVPVDLDDRELLELGAFILVSMRPWIQQALGGVQPGRPSLWTPP